MKKTRREYVVALPAIDLRGTSYGSISQQERFGITRSSNNIEAITHLVFRRQPLQGALIMHKLKEYYGGDGLAKYSAPLEFAQELDKRDRELAELAQIAEILAELGIRAPYNKRIEIADKMLREWDRIRDNWCGKKASGPIFQRR